MSTINANKHGAIVVRDVESDVALLHAAGDPGGNYGTLCGLSTDDDMFEAWEASPTARINCKDCFSMWQSFRRFKASDFTAGEKL